MHNRHPRIIIGPVADTSVPPPSRCTQAHNTTAVMPHSSIGGSTCSDSAHAPHLYRTPYGPLPNPITITFLFNVGKLAACTLLIQLLVCHHSLYWTFQFHTIWIPHHGSSIGMLCILLDAECLSTLAKQPVFQWFLYSKLTYHCKFVIHTA